MISSPSVCLIRQNKMYVDNLNRDNMLSVFCFRLEIAIGTSCHGNVHKQELTVKS